MTAGKLHENWRVRLANGIMFSTFVANYGCGVWDIRLGDAEYIKIDQDFLDRCAEQGYGDCSVVAVEPGKAPLWEDIDFDNFLNDASNK